MKRILIILAVVIGLGFVGVTAYNTWQKAGDPYCD